MKKIYIDRSKIEGKGIFAGEDIEAGEHFQNVIGMLKYQHSETVEDALSIPNWYGVGKNIWIDPEDSEYRYLNHSCDPNAAIVSTRKVIARRPIKKGEEITIDYSMTDEDTLWYMPCLCGLKDCRKIIRSIQFLTPEQFLNHMPLIPVYFQQVYLRSYVYSRLQLDHKILQRNARQKI